MIPAAPVTAPPWPASDLDSVSVLTTCGSPAHTGRGGHAAARAEHAETRCAVEHEQCLVGAGGPVQFGDGRLVP